MVPAAEVQAAQSRLAEQSSVGVLVCETIDTQEIQLDQWAETHFSDPLVPAAKRSRTASSSTDRMGGRVILWFRNDLRLLDNACVNAAEKLVQSGKFREVDVASAALFPTTALAAMPSSLSLALVQVVPLYCFDPRSYIRTPYGNHKTGPMRAKFIRESVSLDSS